MSELLTLNRLARTLRMSRAWLKEEALAGRLPCLRVGRKLFFEVAAVRRELAQQAAANRVGVSNGR